MLFLAFCLTIGQRLVARLIVWVNDHMTIEMPVITAILVVMLTLALTTDLIGVHTALQDSTPMVVFIGQVPNEFAEREAFQEIDYRRMYGPLTKWVAQIDRAERIPEYVSHAFHAATSGRPGPVLLALPEATIYVFDGATIQRTPYAEVEHVQLVRAFLNNPQQFLKHF